MISIFDEFTSNEEPDCYKGTISTNHVHILVGHRDGDHVLIGIVVVIIVVVIVVIVIVVVIGVDHINSQ